ncbi:energy transducer TonB [Wenyingzhuangia sp. IMCC45533]
MTFIAFLMFYCGLRYLDPPEEYGIAINFGTSDVGSGQPKLNKKIQSDLKQKPVSEDALPKNSPRNESKDDVLSQDIEEAPVLKKEKNKQPKKNEVVDVDEATKQAKEAQKPTQATQNVLSNLFGEKSEAADSNSEGDDDEVGVKGALDGIPDSDKYYGNSGSGGDGNYLLKGRKTLSKPKKKPNCNEEGVVVVKIEVDNQGNVINAIPGVKGTTNPNPCLLEPAKKAALSTKWNADGNAPQRQVGFIRYKFILSE